MAAVTPATFLPQWIRADGQQMPLLLTTSDSVALTEAVNLAMRLTACEKQEDTPCGSCTGCKQALSGAYPDILAVPDDTPLISVKQILALLEPLGQHAFRERRLVIIPKAERLSPPAAAALLKTLEEPAPATRFLLTSVHRRRMLATILSRCQILRLPSKASASSVEAWPTFKDNPENLSPDTLSGISHFLENQLKTSGSRPDILRAYMRLRDYYKITSKRGNTKLATAVLLATLEQIRK